MKKRSLALAVLLSIAAPSIACAERPAQPLCKLYHILPGAGGTGYFYSWIPCNAGVLR